MSKTRVDEESVWVAVGRHWVVEGSFWVDGRQTGAGIAGVLWKGRLIGRDTEPDAGAHHAANKADIPRVDLFVIFSRRSMSRQWESIFACRNMNLRSSHHLKARGSEAL